MLDPKQFETAFTAAAPKLWSIALAMCRHHHTAQDVVQEAGMIAWRKRDQFEPGTNFGAWCGQIVRNLALRKNRDRARKATVALEPGLAPPAETGPDELPSTLAFSGGPEAASGTPTAASAQTVSAAETDQARVEHLGDTLKIDDRLAAALSDLTEIARTCFLLRSVEHQTYDEISVLLDIKPNTAMSHVHRARKKLLLAMQNESESPAPSSASRSTTEPDPEASS